MCILQLIALSMISSPLIICTMDYDCSLGLVEVVDPYSSRLGAIEYDKKEHIFESQKYEQSDDLSAEFKLQKTSGTSQSVMYQKHLYDSYRAVIRLAYCLGKANQCKPLRRESETIYRKKIKNTGTIIHTTCTAEIQKKLLEAYTKNPSLFESVAQYVVEQQSDHFYKNGYEQALKDVVKIVGGGSILYCAWVLLGT